MRNRDPLVADRVHQSRARGSQRTTAWPSRAPSATETREGFEARFLIVLPLRGPVTALLLLPPSGFAAYAPGRQRPYVTPVRIRGLREPGMDQEGDRLNRYAEKLLADRRPSRACPNEHGLHARQAAALLSGMRPGAGIPSRRFLTGLERQIAQWIREGTGRPSIPARIGPDSAIVSAFGGVASGLLNGSRWRGRRFSPQRRIINLVQRTERALPPEARRG